jgi:hypothetical protein
MKLGLKFYLNCPSWKKIISHLGMIIPDEKGGEWNVFMFGALKVVAPPPMLIKDHVGWALMNNHRLCTDTYEIYGVL